ncbi:thiamine diphosphokinase [Clostridium intestinale]|uniref:Thiamine diphosphokinase n=1 Tax=Clostridium intestinale URNW TaxID=1294142 RepID=U2NR94_9CLOT|nr:thiamine diphosphokinase [Clostridium intestinale]ERK31401.1 thiamine pyrophosphokinase [Clostridium intestinale URNW]
MKILIVSGGKTPSKELLMEQVKDSSLILGADRGCQVLIENGIFPNYIMGDFDSIDEEAYKKLRDLKIEMIEFNPEKDFTDSELAFEKAIELGATEIVLLGFTGTRLDHVLANLGLLDKALALGIKCEILDDNNRIFLVDKDTILKGKKGQTISFNFYNTVVEKFNIRGAKYPLVDYRFDGFTGRTVSNEFIDGDISITFKSGKILVFYTND